MVSLCVREWNILHARKLYTETWLQETAYKVLLHFTKLNHWNSIVPRHTSMHYEIMLYRIDANFVIKVADFGLSESVGTKDYFR